MKQKQTGLSEKWDKYNPERMRLLLDWMKKLDRVKVKVNEEDRDGNADNTDR